MKNQSAAPGWYHAEGDPAGTQRFWDGAQWSAEPLPSAPAQTNSLAPVNSVAPDFAAVQKGTDAWSSTAAQSHGVTLATAQAPLANQAPSTDQASGFHVPTQAAGAPIERGLWENFKFVALDNFSNFNGRARRREYWLFNLVNIFIFIGLVIPTIVLADPVDGIAGAAWIPIILGGLLFLALTIPTLAVTVRRLHDTDRSGAWYFVSFVPWIGGIWLLSLVAKPGTVGNNQYGPDPKALR